MENETEHDFYAECQDCGHVHDEIQDDFNGVCLECGSENLVFEKTMDFTVKCEDCGSAVDLEDEAANFHEPSGAFCCTSCGALNM